MKGKAVPTTSAEPKCHDCDVEPGQFHEPGCDVERCPYCGRQLISCGCLEVKKRAAWIEKHLLPWTGVWPGAQEAAEFGLFCKWVPNEQFEADKKKLGVEKAIRRLKGPPGQWVECGKDEPGAQPSLNRLMQVAVWDREKRRFVRRA